MQSKVAQLVKLMFDYAAKVNDDRVSVMVSRVADRLAHQGSPFERPLTLHERAVVQFFVEMEKSA